MSASPCTEVWALDAGPGRGPCCTKLTWPDDWKETLGGGRGYHHENILRCCVVDRDEKDVEDNLPDFEAYPGHPRAESCRVGEVSRVSSMKKTAAYAGCMPSQYTEVTPNLCVLFRLPWS